MAHFKVIKNTFVSTLPVGAVIPESDYSVLCPDGSFVQMEHIPDPEQNDKYEVSPGVWTINYNNNTGFFLSRTDYVQDKVLLDFLSTKNITEKIDRFFNKIHIYKEYGIEVPKRGIFMYGPPGTGKSTSIAQAAHKYGIDGRTAIIVWSTDKYEAHHVRSFMKTFNYVKGAERVILIVEDIGGVEVDQVRMKSDSSLLALLDNQEKVFTTPILIIATTNFPEVFMGNLTNRPGRFDDKIEVPYPSGEQRVKLFKFFSKVEVSKEAVELMEDRLTKEFSAAHIREVILRSALDETPHEDVIRDMAREIEFYKKDFTKENGMGININED